MQIIKSKNNIKKNQHLLGQFLKVLKKNKNNLQSYHDRPHQRSFTNAISLSKIDQRRSGSNIKCEKSNKQLEKAQLGQENYWNSKMDKNKDKIKKAIKNKQHKTINIQQQRQLRNPSNFGNGLLDKKLSFDLHRRSNQIVQKLVQSKSLKNHYKNYNRRFKTQFTTQPIPPIKTITKLSQSKNSRVLSFSQMKPTDQYFANLNNIKLVERLLLVQPSKDTSYSEHKKFYNNHKVIANHISSSRVSSRLSTTQGRTRTKLPNLIKNSKLQKQHRKYSQWRD